MSKPARISWIVKAGAFVGAVAAIVWAVESLGRPSASASKPPEVEAEAIEVVAPDLHAEFAANEIAAERKYGGGPVVVAGVVVEVQRTLLGTMVVSLAGAPGSPVTAELRANQADKAAALKVGQPALVKCAGARRVLGSPYLRDCRIGVIQ